MTDDSISELNKYEALNLSTASSCLTIDIANDTEISCLITNKGSVVKKGAGILKLTNNSLMTGFDVQSGWRIEAGGVALPQERTKSNGGYKLTKIYIEKDAYLALCPYCEYDSEGNVTSTTSHTLNFADGEGIVTNMTTSTKGWAGSSLSGTFGGTLGTRIAYGVNYTPFTFTGVNQTVGSGAGVNGTTFSVARSDGLGNSYQFEFGDYGILKYIGTGGATWTKRFLVKNVNGAEISGGENGGLTIEPLEFFDLGTYVKDFYFSGDAGTNIYQMSTHACPIKSPAARVVKKGAGVWWFKHDYRGYERGGATEIREGKLMIDALYDKGEICALGVGTNVAKSVTTSCVFTEDLAVPYGLLLSGGELEFIGSTNAAFAANRGIGVSADSKLTDNGQDVVFGFAGVQCVGETPRTLTLDGTNSLSRLDEVTDGDAALSLKKVGSGTWTLGGNQTFSGMLDVQEGKVRVLNDGDKTKFTYFRISLKECAFSRIGTGDDGAAYVWHFGLFDADGNRLGLKVTDAPSFGNGNLQENEIGWARDSERFNHDDAGDKGGTPKRMFCEGWYFGYSKGAVVNQTTYNDRRPYLNIPRTWQRFVVRLPDDIAEVTSYDMVTPSPSTSGSSITSWSLEGSVDGLYWTELDSKEYPEPMSGGEYKGSPSDSEMYWVSDNSQWVRTTSTTKPTHTGYSITTTRDAKTYSQLEKATVRVAAGAELVTESDVTISALSADAATGMGTITGFKFAENGTFDVANAPKGVFTINAKITAADGSLANVKKWNVAFDGKVNAKYHVKPTAEGGFNVFHDGLIIVVR